MIQMIAFAILLGFHAFAAPQGVCEINIVELMNSARIEPLAGAAKGTYTIEDITPGTYFAKSGLRDGDQIMELNGKTFQSDAEIIAAFNLLKPKNLWKIHRKGKELKLPFSCPLK